MAWQADGFWQNEDSDVQTQVDKVAASNSPLMKRAAAQGRGLAAARGLGNSSIAAGSAQGAVLDKAIAIGGQNASLIAANNQADLQGRWSNKTATTVQGMSDSASMERLKLSNSAEMDRLDKQIAGNLALAQQGDTAAMARLEKDLASRAELQSQTIGSNERIAGMQEAGADRRQGVDVTSRMDIAQLGETGANTRLGQELSSRQTLSESENANRLAIAGLQETGANTRLGQELGSRETISANELTNRTQISEADNANRKDLAQLDATTRLNTAQMEIDANAKNNTINAMVNLQTGYMTSMGQTMSNPKIPATTRAALQQSFKDVTASGIELAGEISGISLSW